MQATGSHRGSMLSLTYVAVQIEETTAYRLHSLFKPPVEQTETSFGRRQMLHATNIHPANSAEMQQELDSLTECTCFAGHGRRDSFDF